MAPLMGLVVRLPSKVLWMVTRYTFVSSMNQMICEGGGAEEGGRGGMAAPSLSPPPLPVS